MQKLEVPQVFAEFSWEREGVTRFIPAPWYDESCECLTCSLAVLVLYAPDDESAIVYAAHFVTMWRAIFERGEPQGAEKICRAQLARWSLLNAAHSATS